MTQMAQFLPRLLILVCAGAIAGCVPTTVEQRPASNTTLPRLTGEAAAVAKLKPALAIKGLQMQPVPASRADALTQYCTGKADVLVLSTDMTDSEVTKCWAAGGRWSAVSSEGLNVYLAPDFNARHSTFDWWA